MSTGRQANTKTDRNVDWEIGGQTDKRQWMMQIDMIMITWIQAFVFEALTADFCYASIMRQVGYQLFKEKLSKPTPLPNLNVIITCLGLTELRHVSWKSVILRKWLHHLLVRHHHGHQTRLKGKSLECHDDKYRMHNNGTNLVNYTHNYFVRNNFNYHNIKNNLLKTTSITSIQIQLDIIIILNIVQRRDKQLVHMNTIICIRIVRTLGLATSRLPCNSISGDSCMSNYFDNLT